MLNRTPSTGTSHLDVLRAAFRAQLADSRRSDARSMDRGFQSQHKALSEAEGDWNTVALTNLYGDAPESFVGFVELMQETTGEKVTSAADLVRLGKLQLRETAEPGTMGYWLTKEGIEDLFTLYQEYNYFQALEQILENGGMYTDLLAETPDKHGLPEQWNGWLSRKVMDQDQAIRWTLRCTLPLEAFMFEFPPATDRELAAMLEMPLGVLLDIKKEYDIH